MRIGSDQLDVAALVGEVRAPTSVTIDPLVLAALDDAARAAQAAAAEHVTYGRTTGVGANRNVPADDHDGGHGLRLVRSHATGAGPHLGDDVARAAMLIRAHQLAIPGSGIPSAVVGALVQALTDGRLWPVRELGGMGTGDITALAELALCLLGERPWVDGATSPYLDTVDASAALTFMSSNAPTLAVAALGANELHTVLDASLVVAALSAAAIRGNAQQWSQAAEGTRPSAGVAAVASLLRRHADGRTWTVARTQDPLSFRCIPFVAGPAIDVLDELTDEVDRCIDARAENPRFADGGVWHHGAFMHTSLGLRLDTARLGLVQWLSTSLARLVKLHDPQYNRRTSFLAEGPSGSSGTMVLEYTAGSALETVRHLADPSSRHTTTISIGTEDHASFASRGATALRDLMPAARVVVACELIAAVRTLRGAGDLQVGESAQEVLDACDGLPADTTDRPLVEDIEQAVALLPHLATLARLY